MMNVTMTKGQGFFLRVIYVFRLGGGLCKVGWLVGWCINESVCDLSGGCGTCKLRDSCNFPDWCTVTQHSHLVVQYLCLRQFLFMREGKYSWQRVQSF